MQNTAEKIHCVNEPWPHLRFLQKTFHVEITEGSFVSLFLSKDLNPSKCLTTGVWFYNDVAGKVLEYKISKGSEHYKMMFRFPSKITSVPKNSFADFYAEQGLSI